MDYWGDLLTHGSAVLHRLRARLPRLNAAEQQVHTDLLTDVHGEHVRLEQERIDWGWVLGTGRSPEPPMS